MKYLCLVYAEEVVRLNAMSQGEIDGLVDESLANTEEPRKSGHPILVRTLEHVERPRPCVCATASYRRGKVHSPRRTSSSADSCSSKPGT